MPKKLLLVDAPNHAFRAYHAMQSDMRAPDGFPTRALFGFTRILLSLAREFNPDYVAFVFDVGDSFRNALYPAYKGQRPDMPADLREQWGELRPLIEAFGYTVVAEPGTEADDVIGTLARRFASDDVHVGIVSADKDFCQIVDERVHLLDLMRKQELGPDEVREKWGVGPDRIVDLLSLMGDASDNVPGVPGVGEKKAAQFVARFGDLDGVLANAATIGGKTGQAIAEHAEAARLARRLVTIQTDLPIDVTLDALAPRPRDEAELRARLYRYNFRTLAAELGLGAPVAVVAPTGVFVSRDAPALWGPALDAAVANIRASGTVALGLVTDGREPLREIPPGEDGLVCLELAWRDGDALRLGRVPLDASGRAATAALLADPSVRKIAFDAKELVKCLHVAGMALGGVCADPMLADYLIVPDQRRELEDVARRHLDAVPSGVPGERAHLALALHETLVRRIEADELSRVYQDIEIPLLPVLADMEIAGIGVDLDALGGLASELDARLAAKEAEVHAHAGEPFNVGSTQQLAVILFEKLALKGGKRTKTGWSTDADTLDRLVGEHPLPGAVLEWRELHKLRNTYVEALPAAVSRRDGRIHTTFRQGVAATGRLSSFNPNLQNIPIRTEEGRRIRRCFVARPGHVFVSCDYSQIELRLLAHYCETGPLVESFRAGEDIHRRTASEIFGVMPALVTAEQRRAAKAINFGIVYGMGPARLANDLRIPRAEAQRYIEGYFARYPQVRATMTAATSRAREKGYAETLYGRRRPVVGLDAGNPMDRSAAERVAINTPIQGSAADLVKLAMIEVHRLLRGTGTRMLLQVHDELVLEAPEGDAEEVRTVVRRAMEGVAVLGVPLVVDSGVARTWDGAHG